MVENTDQEHESQFHFIESAIPKSFGEHRRYPIKPSNPESKHAVVVKFTELLPDPADEADREMSRILEGFRAFNTGGIPGVFVTRTVQAGSNKNDDPIYDESKAKELF